MADRHVVFLDACALYPGLVRETLLAAGEAGAVRPTWSPRVLEEWRLAALRDGADEAALAAALAEMAMRFPDAVIQPDPELEARLELPDAADRHVLAGAVAAGAEALVTFNLRDFPVRRLARFGIQPRHPDSLLWEILSGADPGLVTAWRMIFAAANAGEPREARKLLKKARLSRFGKAWEAMVS